jgi:hypothetical protein
MWLLWACQLNTTREHSSSVDSHINLSQLRLVSMQLHGCDRPPDENTSNFTLQTQSHRSFYFIYLLNGWYNAPYANRNKAMNRRPRLRHVDCTLHGWNDEPVTLRYVTLCAFLHDNVILFANAAHTQIAGHPLLLSPWLARLPSWRQRWKLQVQYSALPLLPPRGG